MAASLTTRPEVFKVTITNAGQAVKFDMPDGAMWWAMKVRTATGKVKVSHSGTVGQAVADPYFTVDGGGGFSMPEMTSFKTSLGDLYFDDNGGTLPCVVEMVVS